MKTEMAEKCETCDGLTYAPGDGEWGAKWCCHCGAKLTGKYVPLVLPDGFVLVPVEPIMETCPECGGDGNLRDVGVIEALQEAADFYRSQTVICEEDDNEHTASQWRERRENIDAALAAYKGAAQQSVAVDERAAFERDDRFRGMDFTRSATNPEYYESPYANGALDGWKARAALAGGAK